MILLLHIQKNLQLQNDSMVKNMDISLVSPAVVQQILWDSYLKKETTEKWETKISINEPEKVTDADKLKLAQGHLTLMKSHLENYKDSDLSDFYTIFILK